MQDVILAKMLANNLKSGFKKKLNGKFHKMYRRDSLHVPSFVSEFHVQIHTEEVTGLADAKSSAFEAGEETALQRKLLALFDEADWPWEAGAMVAEGYAALS